MELPEKRWAELLEKNPGKMLLCHLLVDHGRDAKSFMRVAGQSSNALRHMLSPSINAGRRYRKQTARAYFSQAKICQK